MVDCTTRPPPPLTHKMVKLLLHVREEMEAWEICNCRVCIGWEQPIGVRVSRESKLAILQGCSTARNGIFRADGTFFAERVRGTEGHLEVTEADEDRQPRLGFYSNLPLFRWSGNATPTRLAEFNSYWREGLFGNYDSHKIRFASGVHVIGVLILEVYLWMRKESVRGT